MRILDKIEKYMVEQKDLVKPNLSIRDAKILRKSIQEELQAINDYTERAYNAENPAVKELFLEIAYEEKVHFGEFEEMLELVDPEHDPAEEEGEEEMEKFVEPDDDEMTSDYENEYNMDNME
jgi:rubrerythrin